MDGGHSYSEFCLAVAWFLEHCVRDLKVAGSIPRSRQVMTEVLLCEG